MIIAKPTAKELLERCVKENFLECKHKLKEVNIDIVANLVNEANSKIKFGKI